MEFLGTNLLAYAIIAAAVVAVMTLLRKFLPAVALFINMAIGITAVVFAFGSLHWVFALKVLGIFFLLMIVARAIFSFSSGSAKGGGTVPGCITYSGKDANGKDIIEVKVPKDLNKS